MNTCILFSYYTVLQNFLLIFYLYSIITLEDVLEALLQQEILDEMDAAGRMSHMEVDGEGIQHDESDGGTVYRQFA